MPALGHATEAFNAYHQAVLTQVVSAQSITAKGEDVFQQGEPVTQALTDFSMVVYAGVVQALTDRVQSEMRVATMNGVALAVVVLFGLALSALITRAVVNPMTHAVVGVQVHLHRPLRQSDRAVRHRRARPGAAGTARTCRRSCGA